MEKYGVEQDPKKTKTASETRTCPKCGSDKVDWSGAIPICPNCGTPYHCEDPSADDGKQEDERGPLECARLISICSHCPQPVVLGSRHEFIPDD